jgi:glycine cleavage system H protein
MTTTPDDLRYTNDHFWVRPPLDRGAIVVGLTDFAQESLGDIIAVDLPETSDRIESGQPCGDVESTKTLSDLIAPLTGTVATVNAALVKQPELINTDPYGEGWLFEVSVDTGELKVAIDSLLTPAQYTTLSTGA